jgi:hypothetical protein
MAMFDTDTLQDYGSNMRSGLRDATSRLPSGEDLLGSVGLSYRRSATEALIATLGAFALGAAVGATIALLMAPRSGAEMRGQLRQQARDLGERAQETAQQVGDRVRSGMNA